MNYLLAGLVKWGSQILELFRRLSLTASCGVYARDKFSNFFWGGAIGSSSKIHLPADPFRVAEGLQFNICPFCSRDA